MKIGILYPRSTAHPSMSMDFMDGFKTFIRTNNLSNVVTVAAENAGFGGAEKEVMEKIEKLLMEAGADILVLYIDLKVFAMVKPMLEATGKLVIIVNPGADYPQTWVSSPNIVHLNLNHAFLCWLTGRLAADKAETQAAFATSFYDCGYLHSAMMVSNFTIHGGKIMYNYVNRQAYQDGFHLKELLDYLAEDKVTGKVLCVYDELPARLVYQAFNAFDDAARIQLYVSPMMMQDKALEDLRHQFKFSVEGYLPWVTLLQSSDNLEFTAKIVEATGKAASIFSLLGWEAATLVAKAMESSLNPRNGSGIVEYLSNTPIASPRGSMHFDRQTHWFLMPLIKRTIQSNSSHVEQSTEDFDTTKWQDYLNNPPRGVVSGWTNAYLCY